MFYSLFDQNLNRRIYVPVGSDLKNYWWEETLEKNLFGHTLWVHNGDFDIEAHEKQREVTHRQDDIVTTLKQALRRLQKEDDFEELLARAKKALDL